MKTFIASFMEKAAFPIPTGALGGAAMRVAKAVGKGGPPSGLASKLKPEEYGRIGNLMGHGTHKPGVVDRAGEWVSNLGKRQLAGLGVKRYAHTLKPGMGTLPGEAKAYAKDPVGKFKRHAGETLKSPMNVAFMAGMPLLDKDRIKDPKTRGSAIGGHVGSALGWMAVPHMPIVPQMLAWHAFDRAGERVGKLFDKK